MLGPTVFKQVPIVDAASMLSYSRELPLQDLPHWWLFRGMSRHCDLKTSLERMLDEAGIDLAEAPDYERKLMKEFKRRAHFYLHQLPATGDVLGWLALMQHHGAPTRLLDWTYSFFIAAFFALADAVSNPPEKREPAIVWALYRDAFKLEAQDSDAKAAFDAADPKSPQDDIRRSDADGVYDGINAYLMHVMKNPKPSVWAVNAFRMNERLSVQRGLFLCPGDVRTSFENNLNAAGPSPANVVCFRLSTEPKARGEMLGALHRMNINNASLFPGLDGFARSLNQTAWVQFRLRPDQPSHG